MKPQKLCFKTGGVFIIEDSPSGVEAAFRADIRCIMVPDLIKAGKKQEQQTKYIAKSLLDVIEYMKHVL